LKKIKEHDLGEEANFSTKRVWNRTDSEMTQIWVSREKKRIWVWVVPGKGKSCGKESK